ncbi:MAG: 50S ribosomal protein L4 [Erysipelotrichaceae bacterium]|nr:50S ribosomal protein L4 [Erysipelotrichaceae bacterium]
MAKFDVYDLSANKVGDVELADSVFAAKVNEQAMFDAILRQQSSLRQGTHKAKTRSEVSGGGRKPFRQKGTGRARQGSSRAVQYRGGGIAFGPVPRSHTFKLNRKIRRLALRSGLSQKVNEEKLFVLDSIEVANIKTAEFKKVLDAFNKENGRIKPLFVVDVEENYENAYLSARNIPDVEMVTVEGLNIYDLVNANKLFVTKAAALKIGEVLSDD